MQYEIQLTPLAIEMLAAVRDRREQEKLVERIEQLKIDPEKQGKALIDSLLGFRRVRHQFNLKTFKHERYRVHPNLLS